MTYLCTLKANLEVISGHLFTTEIQIRQDTKHIKTAILNHSGKAIRELLTKEKLGAFLVFDLELWPLLPDTAFNTLNHMD